MGTDLTRMPVQTGSESEAVEQETVNAPAPEWPAPVAQPAVSAMSVGAADDPAEAAADRLADSALARLHTGHAHHAPAGTASSAPSAGVHRSVVPGGSREGGALDEGTAAAIASRTGGGRPMDEPVRRRMEGAFGQSFSSVRVHDDKGAADLSSSISAQAFTTGRDVFLGSGIDTATPSGERVLAHELAHVVQNGTREAPVQRWFGKSKKDAAPKSGAPNLIGGGELDAPEREPEAPKAKAKEKLTPAETPGAEGLQEDAKKAFVTAKKFSPAYSDWERKTAAWVTQKQQKEIADISSWSKRAKGDDDKRTLKDLLRAFILSQYVDIVELKLKGPATTTAGALRALDKDERKAMESKYFPKTLQNRDKWKGLIDKGPYAPETQTWLEDAGFDGAIERTPDQKATDAGGPKLDVRSTFIGGEILGAPRRMHLFLVYTSSDGDQTYLRGGPSEDDWTECDIGPYDTDSVDWDPSAPSVTVATGDKAIKSLDKMQHAAEIINQMKIPYVAATVKANKGGLGGLEALLTGENCNSTAWTLLQMGGVEKKKPSGLHPGWGHKLGAILNPDVALQLDVPENVGAGAAAKLAGDARANVQIFGDRTGTEKLITQPGGSDIMVVKDMGNLTQIRFGPQATVGYVQGTDVFVPPEVGRKFWVAGPKGSITMIIGTDGFADGGAEIEVLDADWMPGKAGDVRVRYSDQFGGHFEGTLRSSDVTDRDPAPLNGVVVPPSLVQPDNAPDDAPRVVAELDPLERREVILNFRTASMVSLCNMDGSPQDMSALDGTGQVIGATGTRFRLDNGDVMVEFVIAGVYAWMDEASWEDTFEKPYPNV